MAFTKEEIKEEVGSIETFLALVRADEFHCFWG